MSGLLTRINAAVLFVADLERAKSVYRDALELTLTFEDAASVVFPLDTAVLILLSLPGARDLLTAEAVSEPHERGARSQLVSFVDDVDAVHARLAAKGVDFIRAPVDRDWGMRTSHFADPDGNVWEIAQQLAGASDQA